MYELESIDYFFIIATIIYIGWLLYDTYIQD